MRHMGRYSVVEAKKRLSELIDRALKGEAVVITRHGRPVIKLKPISGAAKPITSEAIAWLDERCVGRRVPREDAATLVRRMRDEWEG
jgi:prevent-host-death family protein